MEYSSTIQRAGDSFAETGTIVFEGREFTSGGAMLDVERGRGVVYVKKHTDRDDRWRRGLNPAEVTTWDGETLAPAYFGTTWAQRVPGSCWPIQITMIYFKYGGREWYGRWYEDSQQSVRVKTTRERVK